MLIVITSFTPRVSVNLSRLSTAHLGNVAQRSHRLNSPLNFRFPGTQGYRLRLLCLSRSQPGCGRRDVYETHKLEALTVYFEDGTNDSYYHRQPVGAGRTRYRERHGNALRLRLEADVSAA